MKKWFKRGLFTFVVFVIVALVGAAVFLLTFDPNAYKNKVEQLVYERYQRHLNIEGDIELSLFPRIGLAVEHVSLSDHTSDTTFASVDSARFAVAVWPLLWNKLVVDHVAVSGFKVWVERDDEGQFNFSDLLERQIGPTRAASGSLSPLPAAQAEQPQSKSSSIVPDAAQAEFQIDIAGLDLKEGEIHFYDQASATQMRIVNLELNTGRMTFGQPFDVIFKGSLQGEKPVANAALEGQALVQLEPHLYRFGAQKMNINLTGNVGAYTAQSATLRGALELLTLTEDLRARQLELVSQGQWQDADLQLNRAQFNLNVAQLNLKRNLRVINTQKLQWRASGFLPVPEGAAEHKVEVALDVPNIDLELGQVQAEPIALSFKQSHGTQMFGMSLRTKATQGNLESLVLPAVQLDVAGKHGLRAWKLDALSTLQWDHEQQQLTWPDFTAGLLLEDERLNPNPAQAKLTGSGAWFLPEHKLTFDGHWQSANTDAQIQTSLEHDEHWLFAAQVDATELDINPWLQKTPAEAAATNSSNPTNAQTESVMLPSYFDWAGLRTQLSINADELYYRQLQAKELTAQIEQRDRTVHLEQLQAQIFDGEVEAEAQWQHNDSQLQLKTHLSQIDLAQLSAAVGGRVRLTGTGDIGADVQTQGRTALARRAYLDGSLQIQAESGQLEGWNIWRTIAESNEAVRNVFSGQVTPPVEQVDLQQRTPFTRLAVDLQWQQGQGVFKELELLSPGLNVKTLPPSYLDTVNQQVELDLQIDLEAKNLPEAYQGLTELSSHPFYIRFSGPWSKPVYRVQWSRLEHPSVIEAMDHGLLSLLGRSTAEGPPLGLTQNAPNSEVSKTLGDTLKSLLKN